MVELEKQDYEENRKKYLEQERRLKEFLGKDVPVNHVGSTAIPKIQYGKNIIDILVSAKDEAEFKILFEKIEKLSFCYNKINGDGYQFFATRNAETKSGDVHVHLSIIGTPRYEEFLILKDFLLKNDSEAEAYSKHKQELVESGIVDRKKYREIKSQYVQKMIERAIKFSKLK